VKARVTDQGAKGVVHGNRGRPCKRKIKEKTVNRIVELAKGKYRGFNDRYLTRSSRKKSRLSFVEKRSVASFAPMGSLRRGIG
jgi:hypothetical protein